MRSRRGCCSPHKRCEFCPVISGSTCWPMPTGCPMLRPPQTCRAISRVHVSDCVAFELFDIHSQAPGIRVKSGHASLINGLYTLCEKPYCGFPQYQREALPQRWLYRRSECGPWMIGSAHHKEHGLDFCRSVEQDAELPNLTKSWRRGVAFSKSAMSNIQVEADVFTAQKVRHTIDMSRHEAWRY